MFGNAESEEEVRHLVLARRALRYDPAFGGSDAPGVALLHQQPSGDAFHPERLGGGIGEAAGQQQTQVGLLAEYRNGGFIRVRRDDDLGENAGDRQRRLLVERSFTATMPPYADTGSRGAPLVGFHQIGADGHAAGIGVLDDHHGRLLRRKIGESSKAASASLMLL